MAEQLSKLDYKPWLKGNFNTLQVQGVPVLSRASGNTQFLTTVVQTRNVGAPVLTPYELTFQSVLLNGVQLIDNKTIKANVSGLFYFCVNVSLQVLSGGTLHAFVNIKNKTTELSIVGGTQIFNGYFGMANVSGILQVNAGDEVSVLFSDVGSGETCSYIINGFDTFQSSTFCMYQIG
jgi:hypothetical protein